MKRFFLLASAAIAMLCAASCQEEMNGPDVQNGNEVTATVTVKAPGALATKAIADGTKAKNLVLGVFDADNNDKYLYSVGTLGTFNAGEAAVEFNENLTATVELTLMKGKSYKFVCWASDPTLECYTIAENFAAINVSYAVNNESNNENRDAFYACAPSGVVTADYSATITLKRPLAQINVGTTAEDLAAAVKAGLDASKLTVSMVVPNPATALDPITGEATAEPAAENATFTAALSPVAVNPEEKVVVNTQTTKGTYEWLAMNYILVDKDALTNLKFTISEGDREIDTYSVPFAPVQKNWRTNILGDLLTDKGSITVIIDPKFDDIYDVAYGSSVTFAELNAAIKDAKVGTYNVGGKVTEVAEGSAAGYEVVTLTDEEGGSGSYELKVPETKAAYTGFYKVNDYVVVAVSVDSEGNATHDENHVLHIPADVEEEPEVPVEPVLTIAEPEVEVSAEAGEVTFAVESNVEWTVSEVEGLTVTPAEAAFTVAYPANETTEPVTYTLTVSAEGVQAVTVTIKQAAAEVEEPEPVEQVLPDGAYYIVANGNIATPLSKAYGYIQVTNGKANTEANAFTFTYVAEQDAYTIQDSQNNYYYQKGTYDSFNKDAALPETGGYWAIEKVDNTYKITNLAVGKFIQYDPAFTSYGSYTTEKGVLPELLTIDSVIPYTIVNTTSISVAAEVTSAEFTIEANTPWTATASEGATLSATSGSENATITVTFAANETTESKTYTITVSSVNGDKVITVSQSAPVTGDQTVIELSAATRPCDTFPNTSTGVSTTTTYTINGYDWTFSPSSGNKFSWYSDGYILWGKQGGYILMPAVDGKKLSKVTILTGKNASVSVKVGVYNAEGTTAVTGGSAITLSAKDAEFSWTLTDTEVGAQYQLRVTSAHNAQLQKLTLIYE